MSIVDGVGLIEWEGGLFTPDSALLPRVRWAFAQIRAAGGSITLNEAGRPYGVASDTNVGRSGAGSSGTFSGRSTVYYQWGRHLLWRDTGGRQGTPSAADPSGGPYASEHTQGIAIDCNAGNASLRARYFAMVGLSNTIASESWHWAIRGPSQVDLSDYAYTGGNATETPEQRDEKDIQMGTTEILAAIHDRRSVAVVEVNGAIYVADFGAGTKWNVARGQSNVDAAFKFIDFLRDGLGWPDIRKQSPLTLAGLVDVTEEGTVRQEVAEGIRDALNK